MFQLTYTKHFTSGTLEGLTFPVAIRYPDEKSVRRAHSDLLCAQRSDRIIDDLMCSGTYQVRDVEVERCDG